MLQNIPKEKILELVRQGPTIPSKIVKIVGGDTMLIGAILSTMISTGEIKYSSLKFGGSPLYYIPEHEEKLEEYINHLNDKDQKTVRMLKEQRVMMDSVQDPLIRFSLKNIKDFAKPFEVEHKGKKELFYRYFSVMRDEAESLAKDLLKEEIEQPVIEEKTVPQHIEEHIPVIEHLPIIEHTHIVEQSPVIEEEPIIEEKTHTRKEHKTEKNYFFETIKEHIHKMNLDIISKEKIKKTEYTLILKDHGTNEYIYCVAKDKKNVNEGDLSTAYVFAHQKKMNCIFLLTGKLTKKADAMVHKEFKDMKIEFL